MTCLTIAIRCRYPLPARTIALSAGSDAIIRIWDASSGRLIGKLKGHTKTIHALAVSPDGEYLASAGADGKVRFWAIPNR